jgi:lipopolysaccharide export system permease protein
MNKNRETIALQAGGIAPITMIGFILVYGLVWSCLQFGFTQFLGVAGDRTASKIWMTDVRGKNLDEQEVSNLWFNSGNYVVHMASILPSRETGTGITVYELSPDGTRIQQRIYAEKATTGENGWDLHNTEIITPGLFMVEHRESMQVPIKQALSKFNMFKRKAILAEMDIIELYQYITHMKASGSNMERVYTNFYHRFAQAFSLLVMGLIALVLTASTSNVYFSLALALMLTFLYISASSFFVTLGESEVLPPFLAAWMPNIVCGVIFGSVLALRSVSHSKRFKNFS